MKTSKDLERRKQLSRAKEIAILLIATAVVLTIGRLSYISADQARKNAQQIQLTRDILTLNSELLSTIKDAETGQRGFLVTGQEQYLKPYNAAVSSIPEIFKRFQMRTASRVDQAERVKALEPVVAAKLAELKETIDLRRAKRDIEALAIVKSRKGEALMEDIRARCAVIDQVADRRLAQFRAAADRSTWNLRMVSTFGSALLLGLIVTSAITISRGLQRREELFNQAYASQQLLATTLSSIADGVISTDSEARITFMNPVAEELTGWKEAECIGRHISETVRLVNEATREIVANPLLRAIAQETATGLANHTKLISRDGREMFIDDSAAPIRDPRGRIVGGVLVFRDVSGKRQSDVHLAESAATLKRSNEELQQFAFAASHDLRSPLNSASSVAQLLARRFGETLGEEGTQMIGFITEGLNRMSRLVEDLLALATASSTAPDVTRPTNVQDAFQTVLGGLSAHVKESCGVVTSSSLPLVAARDTHVIQILQNILGNALKYRGPEPPTIHVSATREGAEWIISVRDNGIGIDPKYAEQIFLPFKRLHGREYEGSGIGLSTCKKIVSVYGGRIWMESEPRKGSTFFFSLPAVAAAAHTVPT